MKTVCLKMCSFCSSLLLDEIERQSTCELEVDAVAVDILNRLDIESKDSQDLVSTSSYSAVLYVAGTDVMTW